MQLALIVLSAALWGVTNPFIRRASAGIENIQADNFLTKTFLEFKFLFSNLNVNTFLAKLKTGFEIIISIFTLFKNILFWKIKRKILSQKDKKVNEGNWDFNYETAEDFELDLNEKRGYVRIYRINN